ncbi:FkbM family methyltransferase [Rhodovarius sp.]|uniref:FkbM family methyltransferase n=1 Tax=Rhodovarius sp. TaxID=2972673 RepID=UPI0034A22E82
MNVGQLAGYLPDAPTTPEMVLWGFRMILERELEDYNHIPVLQAAFPTMAALSSGLRHSQEFAIRFGEGRSLALLSDAERGFLATLPIGPVLGEPGYFTDFLGVRTRLSYLPGGHDWLDGAFLPAPMEGAIKFHDAQEWRALLRAALEARARGSFSLMELGAGWGPWVCAASRLAALMGLPSARTVAVEADPGKLAFIRSHFSDNALDTGNCRIIGGVVGGDDGDAYFPIRENAAWDYGAHARFTQAGDIGQMQRVACHGLARLLDEETIFDLLHCDIQGAEADTMRAAIATVSRRVRRLVIGTHGRGLEQELFAIFGRAGWTLEDELACQMGRVAGHGEDFLLLADGVQVWFNPAL